MYNPLTKPPQRPEKQCLPPELPPRRLRSPRPLQKFSAKLAKNPHTTKPRSNFPQKTPQTPPVVAPRLVAASHAVPSAPARSAQRSAPPPAPALTPSSRRACRAVWKGRVIASGRSSPLRLRHLFSSTAWQLQLPARRQPSTRPPPPTGAAPRRPPPPTDSAQRSAPPL